MNTPALVTADERAALLAVAVNAAQKAGEVLLDHARRGFTIDYKNVVNLVTNADRGSEECIIAAIRASLPNHRILAEERGRDGDSDSPFLWVIDPLDGTTNFAHGFPFYSVSIGLEYEGQGLLGVVLDPVRQELFTAQAGGGAYLNGTPIRVSDVQQLEKALLVTGFAYDIRETANNNLDHFSRISLRAQGVRRTGSAALDLCYVAAGRLDGYWEVKLSPWDMAAGAVILREAGGLVSGFTADRFSLYDKELVATNGLIHQELLALLNHHAHKS